MTAAAAPKAHDAGWRDRLVDLAATTGVIPDAALRAAARHAARTRLRREAHGGVEAHEERMYRLLTRMSTGPIAEVPDAANEQHYGLPAEFFALLLGPRRKYSCCLWPEGTADIAAAENAMLELTCRRAGVQPGMRILDLGCGWGSLSFWLLEHYDVSVVAVSNSTRQGQWIEWERDRRRLSDRLQIVTADVNTFEPAQRFDLVCSIEMFEHLRNWSALLTRVATWLCDDGALFVHLFTHDRYAYRFEGTWAARRFFTEGTMPSPDLLPRLADSFHVQRRWAVNGTHYAKTLRAWTSQLDANRSRLLTVLESDRSPRHARLLLHRWRLFLLATAEMWATGGGDEWMVSHYLLTRRGGNGANAAAPAR